MPAPRWDKPPPYPSVAFSASQRAYTFGSGRSDFELRISEFASVGQAGASHDWIPDRVRSDRRIIGDCPRYFPSFWFPLAKNAKNAKKNHHLKTDNR